MTDEKVRKEEFHLTGDAVISTIKDLVRAGNVRRITLKNEEGRTLIEIPLIIGVAGAVLLPVWAAIGAIAALAARLTIVVEKVEQPPAAPGSSEATPAEAPEQPMKDIPDSEPGSAPTETL